ncbi:MAG: hypothetical protein ACYC64_14435 [Armatimonadota bacterium]
MMQSKLGFSIAAVLAICLAESVWSYPTSLNYIPTAETVGANRLVVEATNYGYSNVMNSDSTTGWLSQIGIGDRLEFGADNYQDSESNSTYINGKFRLLSESVDTPALAVGVMDVADTGKPTFYSIASKTIGGIRSHFGIMRGSYVHGIVVGADLDIGEKLWLGVDYMPGDFNYFRIGISRNIRPDSWLQFCVGMPNDRTQASTELGFTLSTYIDLRGR